jgi:hypothetical protein
VLLLLLLLLWWSGDVSFEEVRFHDYSLAQVQSRFHAYAVAGFTKG